MQLHRQQVRSRAEVLRGQREVRVLAHVHVLHARRVIGQRALRQVHAQNLRAVQVDSEAAHGAHGELEEGEVHALLDGEGGAEVHGLHTAVERAPVQVARVRPVAVLEVGSHPVLPRLLGAAQITHRHVATQQLRECERLRLVVLHVQQE